MEGSERKNIKNNSEVKILGRRNILAASKFYSAKIIKEDLFKFSRKYL
jgi:hypothetical protein